MKKYRELENVKISEILLVLLVGLFILAAFNGCASGNYGSMTFDRELDNKFTNHQVLPEHSYYITGGYTAPTAILAIHNSYQLDNSSKLWIPVPDVDSSKLKNWIDNLDYNEGFVKGNDYMAAYILAPDGKRVGAWYSSERQTTVQFLEGNMLKVFTPDLKPTFGSDKKEEIIMP